MKSLLETWDIHCRINLYLLNSLSIEQLEAKGPKGKAPRDQFIHMHNVRLMWLKSANPLLLDEQTKLEKNADSAIIENEIRNSGSAISKLLIEAGEPTGRIKGFKPNAMAFLCYLISHESHHRGQIEYSLRWAGLPISDKISYGLWEWGTR